MINIKRNEYRLYWEDIEERIIYAELDDYAWKLAENIYKYKKRNSLYIFHSGKLAAYYSAKDSKKESEVGYIYYSKKTNLHKIIHLKKRISEEVKNYINSLVKIKIYKLTSNELKELILNTLDIFKRALSIHYLTQPQFFEKFEKSKKDLPKILIKRISYARLKYTRVAWTTAIKWCKILLKEYGKRLQLSKEQVESLFYNEIKNGNFNSSKIKDRIKKFVLLSTSHKIKLYTGNAVNRFIEKYEQYKKINLVRGITGNKGIKKARAFVIKNEYLDFSRLQKGMKKGMILIIQNAWPELSKYYKFASALVTNEGGITSHGVVVAREFNIPCIVGTKIATKIFKTGDLVEVNATKGTVKKL